MPQSFFYKVAGPMRDHDLSVDLNGSDEMLANTTEQAQAVVAGGGTWAFWVKPTIGSDMTVVRQWNPDHPDDNTSEFEIRILASGKIWFRYQFRVWQVFEFVTLTREVYWNDETLTDGVWNHVVLYTNTAQTAANECTLYVNNVEDTNISVTQDYATIPTQSGDDDRRIYIGGNEDSDKYLEGRLYNLVWWYGELNASMVDEVYNSGNGQLDLLDDAAVGTNYDAGDMAEKITHWWKFGQDPGDIGIDYAATTGVPGFPAAGPINVGDNAENVTNADLVVDYPGI